MGYGAEDKMRRMTVALMALAIGVAGTAASLGAPPAAGDERAGRFTMQPTDGGFLRLDTATGDVTLCAKVAGTFECRPVKDDRDLQSEIARLVKENNELKAEIKRLDDQLGLNGGKGQAQRKLELPSEQDVDKAFTYLEGMLRKFRDKLKDLEDLGKDGTGKKGTPL
jgi:hypothetical protein